MVKREDERGNLKRGKEDVWGRWKIKSRMLDVGCCQIKSEGPRQRLRQLRV